MLKRKIESAINAYFDGSRDKVLIIDGARQIGKTYILRKIGKQRFRNYIEINLKDDFDGEKLFSKEKVNTIDKFYLRLSSIHGDILGDKEDTVIFLDEIQVYPHLLSMFKPLSQDARYTYVASGSLLGVTLRHTFIPMGSITEIKMYQLDFEEFLYANNVGSEVISYLRDCFERLRQVEPAMHETILQRFKEYILCGGLPDAVTEFVTNRNVMRMRDVHSSTYSYYKDDCSKYDSEHRLKIARIYDMLPSNMENKVKRLQANKISGNKKDTLAKYLDEFDYLISSGIANDVRAVSNPVFPLVESSSKNLIKLYFNDVGILTNILYKNNVDAVLSVDKGPNLGSAYETAAAMELKSHGHDLYYFDSKKVGEVDFLINDYNNLGVLPIEIKSGNDQNNYRAIPKLVDPHGNYKMHLGYVFGNKNVCKKEGNIITVPIYMIMFI